MFSKVIQDWISFSENLWMKSDTQTKVSTVPVEILVKYAVIEVPVVE